MAGSGTGRRRNQRSPEAMAWRRLYSTRTWQAARRAQLVKQPLCERCLSLGRIVPARVVNHRKPHKGDWALFFDPENHQSLCAPCHDGAVQSIERVGFDMTIGTDGWPVDGNHPINRR